MKTITWTVFRVLDDGELEEIGKETTSIDGMPKVAIAKASFRHPLIAKYYKLEVKVADREGL